MRRRKRAVTNGVGSLMVLASGVALSEVTPVDDSTPSVIPHRAAPSPLSAAGASG